MIDPIQAMLERGLDSFDPFPPDSRYHGLAIAERIDAGGRRIRYVRRRFLPPASAQTPIGEHIVTSSDRLDTIAAAHLGNAELSWRVADANLAIRPAALTETAGRRLCIALPAPNPVPGT